MQALGKSYYLKRIISWSKAHNEYFQVERYSTKDIGHSYLATLSKGVVVNFFWPTNSRFPNKILPLHSVIDLNYENAVYVVDC